MKKIKVGDILYFKERKRGGGWRDGDCKVLTVGNKYFTIDSTNMNERIPLTTMSVGMLSDRQIDVYMNRDEFALNQERKRKRNYVIGKVQSLSMEEIEIIYSIITKNNE